MDAYSDLSTCRGIDGYIPWRDIIAYADYMSLDPDVAYAFVKIVRMVDNDRAARIRAKKQGQGQGAELSPRAENLMGRADVTPMAASKEAMFAAARHRAKRGK